MTKMRNFNELTENERKNEIYVTQDADFVSTEILSLLLSLS